MHMFRKPNSILQDYSKNAIEAIYYKKLLKKIDNTFGDDTKVVLGVGGSTLYEIENAANQFKNKKIVLMFGFQAITLKLITKLLKRFKIYFIGY